ncbi:MAG: alpha/beta hydrolase-fold protein, partial [Trueperaceae bacterium]
MRRSIAAAARTVRFTGMDLHVTVPTWARQVVSDLTGMDRAPHPVDARKVARFTLRLPDDVHFEYGFVDEGGRIRADPHAGERADNPWYPELSRARGPDYRPHPLASVDPEVATGSLRRLNLPDPNAGPRGERRVMLYEPRGLDGPAPLLLAHDGTAYLRIGRLPAVMEALASEGRVRPARLAFVDPATPAARQEEYGFGEAYQRFARETLLPALRDRADVSELHLIGASLGGLASTLLAWHAPDDVAGLALQSPAYLGTPQERTFHGVRSSWFLDRLERSDAALPWRVHH